MHLYVVRSTNFRNTSINNIVNNYMTLRSHKNNNCYIQLSLLFKKRKMNYSIYILLGYTLVPIQNI